MDVKNNPYFMFLVLFLCFSLKSNLSHEADTISENKSLSGNQTIISAGGVYELGFFKPGNSSNFYIGMWFQKVSIPTIVWVANRETPISDKYSSELKILDGNLVLLNNESQIPIWSTNLTSTTSNSIEAVLYDTGNFVLRDGSDSSSEPLWQSFDHPADTWFPGAKLGYDKRTNTSKPLTAWKSLEDPAPGLFSASLDPNGTNQYLFLWNLSEIYWKTGAWTGEYFDHIPEINSGHIFRITRDSNENETYFIFTVKDPTTTVKFWIDVSGRFKAWRWLQSDQQWNLFSSVPRQQCDVYALCGIFSSCNVISESFCNCLTGFEPKSENDWNLKDYSGGCVRKTPLQCGNISTVNEERDRFFANTSMKLPDDPQSVAVGSDEECKSTCLNNCSCTAYAYDLTNCSLWFGGLLNLQHLSEGHEGKTLYIRLAASEFPASEFPSSTNNTGKVIGIVVGSVAGVGVLFGLVFFVFLRLKRSIGTAKAGDGSLVLFGYRDLQNATKNFTEKLGDGGFGSVFKGKLPDLTAIAVKKLEGIRQGEKQFRTEVSTMGIIQHVNIVRLRGFCCEGTKRLLVYDYMTNGSLDAHLFHGKDSKILDWKTRYQIALGTARGLVYLHEKCRDCIIHCDIKPENILLDIEFCPKVADFGMAKLIGRDFSRVLTTMRGTRGYLAPEWISGVAITPKADVYSFGMMLFELISGRRNSALSVNGKHFPIFAASKITQGEDIFGLLDQRLNGNAEEEEVTRVCRVACWCIQDDENDRPSMSQVVQMLEGLSDVSLPPIPRNLQLLADNLYLSSNKSSQACCNDPTASSQSKSIASSTSLKSSFCYN